MRYMDAADNFCRQTVGRVKYVIYFTAYGALVLYAEGLAAYLVSGLA